jgi:plastocyanin
MRSATTALLLAAVLFAGAASAEEAGVYKLVMRDGRFEPAVVEVPAGKRFRLEVTNEGTKAMEFESKDLKQEKIVAPGKSVTMTIRPLKAGEYRFFDDINESTRGRLVVK